MTKNLMFAPGEMATTEFLNRMAPRLIGTNSPSGVATLSFSSIPQTFKHLLLVGKGRVSSATIGAGIGIRFNTVSTANYHDQLLQGIVATPSAQEALLATSARIGFFPGTSALSTADDGWAYVLMPNYAATTSFPSYVALAGEHYNTTTGTGRAQHLGGQLQSATGAISTVTLLTQDASNFVADTRFDLWGLT